jgi:hypothetical protein
MTRGVRIGMKDNHGITIYDLLNNDLLNNDNLKLDQSYINMINEMNHAVQMKRNQMLALMKLKRLEGILPLELLQRVHGFQ